MTSKRIISNSKGKAKQLQTKMLEEQTRKMEEKLVDLKKFMEQQKQKREEEKMNDSASRWKTASSTNAKAPLKNYAQKILEEQREAFKKYGVNPKKIIGTKTFKPIIDMIKPPKPVESIPTPEQQPKIETAAIEGKFGKARIEVPIANHRMQSIQEFLAQLNLNQYIQTFEANGFDDIELLKDATREDLEKIGVSTGHQIKIIKNLKKIFEDPQPAQEVRPPLPNLPPISKQPLRQDLKRASINEFNKVSKEQPDQDDYSEDFYEQDPQQQPASTGSLLDGQYDEQKNRREFEQAVLAYRGVYKQIEQIEQQQYSVQTELPTRSASICFSCYRSTLTPVFFLSKAFCSQPCLDKYSASVSEKCTTCAKQFLKFEGACVEGVRYCSAKCSPQEQMEALFIKWRLEENQKQKQSANFEDSLEM